MVGEAQQDAEGDEHGCHEPQAAERGHDVVLQQQPEHDDRDGPDNDQPPHPCVGVIVGAASEHGREPRFEDPEDVPPEEHEHARFGAELSDGGERRARVLGAGEELPHDPQVGGGGDGEELSEVLDQSQDDRFDP